MIRSLLGFIAVCWFDLTTLPFKQFLQKYRLKAIPMDGYQGKDDRKAGRAFFPTGPNIPSGTVYRMRQENARSWHWAWYAIAKDGSLNGVNENVAQILLHRGWKIRRQSQALVLGLLVLPLLLAYAVYALVR
jgi:hypothetical protein